MRDLCNKKHLVILRRETDDEVMHWLNELPLIEVARAWGLNVSAYDGQIRGPQEKYLPGSYIAVGVKNLSTWAHELIHAADDKL